MPSPYINTHSIEGGVNPPYNTTWVTKPPDTHPTNPQPTPTASQESCVKALESLFRLLVDCDELAVLGKLHRVSGELAPTT
jgi:hypothetical protein